MTIKDHPVDLIYIWTKSFKVLIWVFKSVQVIIYVYSTHHQIVRRGNDHEENEVDMKLILGQELW